MRRTKRPAELVHRQPHRGEGARKGEQEAVIRRGKGKWEETALSLGTEKGAEATKAAAAAKQRKKGPAVQEVGKKVTRSSPRGIPAAEGRKLRSADKRK